MEEFCKNALKNRDTIIQNWENGEAFDPEMAVYYLTCRAICKDTETEKYWDGYNKNVRGIKQKTAHQEQYYTPEHFLTHEQIKTWVNEMFNEKSSGAKWTMQETTKVATEMAIPMKIIDAHDWWAAMNMIYSDMYDVAVMFNVDNTKFYAECAKKFLFDVDTESPRGNLYHKWCARKK